MTVPASFRLRMLNFAMRRLVQPKLRRTSTPEKAQRDFERAAPLLFSVPKGTNSAQTGDMVRVTVPPALPDRAIVYLHGGAFLSGSPRSYRALTARLAKRTQAAVFVPDYPLLQEAPFPAAPRAVLAAWDNLIAQGWTPSQIVIAGDSAGGNLVFGLLAELLARGDRPAGVLAFSPWVDLTLSGETIATHARLDALLPVSRMPEVVDLYLDGADPADRQASPLFADFPDPPPCLIQVGAEEALLSDAQRIAAKTNATLTVWPNCPHVWQMFDGRLPEARAAMREAAAFVQTSFERASRNPTASAT